MSFVAKKQITIDVKYDGDNATTTHQDIYVTVGDTFLLTFNIKDKYGDLVDLTGVTATYALSKSGYSASVLDVTPTVGTNTVTVEGSLSSLEAGKYYGDLTLTLSGSSLMVIRGNFRVQSKIQ